MIRLSSGFAVPFGETFLTGHERLNRELEALFLARESDEYRNPTPSHSPQAETFESRFNLFKWPEPCVRELRDFVLSSVGQTALHASTAQAEELGKLTLHNHTWYHISRYAGSFVAHNHPLASWSAVYCVRAGERVPSTRAADSLSSSTPVSVRTPTSTRAPAASRPLTRSGPGKCPSRRGSW